MKRLLKNYFSGIYENRYILFSLINVDLQSKYRRSALGVLWAIITPLGLSVIIGSVYSIIFGSDPTYFIPMLFAGLNPWIFLSGSADGGTYSFISAEGYIKQTTTNIQIFPIRTVTVAFINLLYSVIAFFAIYLFLQPNSFSPIMLMTIPGLIIQYFFAVGLANITSIINLKIRDFQPFQSLVLQGLFYATPVIFDSSILDEKGFELIYKLNPFYYMISVVKMPMLGEKLLDPIDYLIAIVLAVVVFFFGVILIMKNKKTIAYQL